MALNFDIRKSKPNSLNSLRKKRIVILNEAINPFFPDLNQREILRFAQNDTREGLFSSF